MEVLRMEGDVTMDRLLQDAVIVAYGRSPIGKARKGALATKHPVDLAAEVLNGVLARVPQLKPEWIDDVLLGCATTNATQSGNLARLVTMRAGLPESVPAATINRFCSSGIQAIAMASQSIMSGQDDIVVAGGVESMSTTETGVKPEYRSKWLEDHMPMAYIPMGITAENVAERYHINREDMDRMAMESHTKAHAAQTSGAFCREIIPIPIGTPEGQTAMMHKDEGIRLSTLEALAGLKPAFKENGSVTAASSSQTSDGAAFVVLMSNVKAAELNIKPIGRLLGYAVAGVPAEIMGTGPIAAVPKLMKRLSMRVEDMDVIELNEAFASQALFCIRQLGLDPAKVNPRGGALALGHPMGATGAVLTSKALSYLEDKGGRYGLITMCIGGGMGAAGIIEKI